MIETITRDAGVAKAVAKPARPGADREDGAEQEVFKPWSKQDAETWRENNPPSSPWRVVAAQAVTGLVCAAIVWALTQRGEAAWSALYGAAAVVLPSALLARGMTKRARNPMAMATGFMFWEMLKIGVAIAMLAIAVRVVPNLSWPALLVAMVVCIKVNWVALLWRGRRSVNKA